MNTNHFFYFLLVTFLFSCHKDSTPPAYKLSDEVKHFFFFKKGSKWIYQNDSTMARDTVTVVDSDINEAAHESDMKIDYYEEVATVNYYSTYNGKNTSPHYNYSYSDILHAYRYYSYSTCIRIYESDSNVPLWPSLQYSNVMDTVNYNISIQSVGLMVFNGINYQNVYKVHIDNKKPSDQPTFKATDYFFTNSTGIIKKVFYYGTCTSCTPTVSWSLLDKKTIQ